MPSNLRKCRCQLAMTALVVDGQGLDRALFLCTLCDSPEQSEASWIATYWRRKLSERGDA